MMVPFSPISALTGGLSACAGNHVGDAAFGVPAVRAPSAFRAASPTGAAGYRKPIKPRRKRQPVPVSTRKKDASPSRRKAYVVMGVDFGTAFTKVAIRAPYEPDGGNTAYAVEFRNRPDSPCMLPTAVWVDKGGRCWIDKASGRKQFTGVKISVMHPSKDSSRGFALAAAYLALVIREARGWLAKRQPFGSGIDLDWLYHIGIPAETARGALADDYSRVANAAIVLSDSSKFPQITLRSAEDAVALNRDENRGDLVVPEVIAQAYGYVRDIGSPEGIHVMVDAGAWTLDVCSFNNKKNHDDSLSLHAASVKPLGCMHLHQARMNAIRSVVLPNQFQMLPRPDEYWERIEKSGPTAIVRADGDFCGKCAESIHGVLSTSMQQSRKMIEDMKGLPVIICGGGLEVPLFQKAAEQGWEKTRRAHGAKVGSTRKQLPKPGLVGRGIGENNYHRFSVAWGLSYPDIPDDYEPPPASPASAPISPQFPPRDFRD